MWTGCAAGSRCTPGAAQEALIVILKNLRGLRKRAAIYRWARAIGVREAVRVARNTARAVPAELADVPARGDPQLAADGVTCRRGSPRAPRHAGPARPGGLDEQVAGALLNLPAATVRTLLSRPGAASGRRGGMNQDWPVANPRPGPPDAG